MAKQQRNKRTGPDLRTGAAVVADTGMAGTIIEVLPDFPDAEGGVRVTWEGAQSTVVPRRALTVERDRIVVRTDTEERTTGTETAGRTATSGDTLTVPIIAEELSAGVVWRDAGAVRLRVRTEEEPRSLSQVAAHEELVIEEVPVGLPLAPGQVAEPRREGEVWIVPIVEEVPVVTMQRMVVKEVRVTKRTVQTERTVAATIRRQRVEVDAGALTERVHTAGTEPANQITDAEEKASPSASFHSVK